MVYVAVAELFSKSEESFQAAGHDEVHSKLYSSLSFFAGAIFIWGSSVLTSLLSPDAHLLTHGELPTGEDSHDHGDGTGWHTHFGVARSKSSKPAAKQETVETNGQECDRLSELLKAQMIKELAAPFKATAMVVSAKPEPAPEPTQQSAEPTAEMVSNDAERDRLSQHMRAKLMKDMYPSDSTDKITPAVLPEAAPVVSHSALSDNEIERKRLSKMMLAKMTGDASPATPVAAPEPKADPSEAQFVQKDADLGVSMELKAEIVQQPMDPQKAILHRMGLRAVLAVALHNYPEGLAAFLTTFADGRSGMGIAFGVILHNFPEGLVVAAPIYAATHSRARALGWASVAAGAEILGGLTGQILVSSSGGDLSDDGYGAVYGMVNGMVVMITVLEFLPHALELDRSPSKIWATSAFMFGMFLIAITLVTEMIE
eukprot:TRINITY_DN38925_c0_g1_i1.p1 TRINITY_DN38925_c0_g1~~TRINITY_DN38925_c0_g1_i1.p1  ORF type:complete len:429 (+),score=91.27 TRINITY_DN38925_c0_g1_i1:160-1446(+)